MKSVFTDGYDAFLECLVAARKSAGLTQQELARRLEKPQSFVSKYERRERRLDVIEFLAVSKAIGVDPCRVIRRIQGRVKELRRGVSG